MELMLNPWTVFSSLIVGGFAGWFFPAFAAQISPLGHLYINLLQMSVIPILLTAITGSLARLFISGSATHYVGRLLFGIVSGLLIASVIGILVGQIGKPGASLEKKAQATLGTTISNKEFDSSQPASEKRDTGLISFFNAMIPDNIFSALTLGNRLSITFFSIVVGVALGSVGAQLATPALATIDAFYETFLKITSWLMYGLPLGLFCLTAGHISELGFGIIGAMLKLLLFIVVGAVLLMSIYTIVIWLRVGGNIFRSFSALRETLIVALGTASSFATIPSALRGLKEGLNIDKDTADLVLPLGITINPPGSVFHFALSTLFISQLFGVRLSLEQYFLVFIGTTLAGIAASGAPGIAALSMIGIILHPLGLPYGVTIILLAAIDPIVDPILTLVNVHANCATTVFVSSKHEDAPLVGDGDVMIQPLTNQ